MASFTDAASPTPEVLPVCKRLEDALIAAANRRNLAEAERRAQSQRTTSESSNLPVAHPQCSSEPNRAPDSPKTEPRQLSLSRPESEHSSMDRKDLPSLEEMRARLGLTEAPSKQHHAADKSLVPPEAKSIAATEAAPSKSANHSPLEAEQTSAKDDSYSPPDPTLIENIDTHVSREDLVEDMAGPGKRTKARASEEKAPKDYRYAHTMDLLKQLDLDVAEVVEALESLTIKKKPCSPTRQTSPEVWEVMNQAYLEQIEEARKQQREDERKAEKEMMRSPLRIIVTNIAADANVSDIKEAYRQKAFQSFGHIGSYTLHLLPERAEGRGTQTAYLDFEDPRDADKVALIRVSIFGLFVRAELASDRHKKVYGQCAAYLP